MVREIPLVNGGVALVDDADFDQLSQFRWRAVRSKRMFGPDRFYAARTEERPRVDGVRKRVQVFMHKMIIPEHKIIDHRDGNGLNNQCENLRPATPSLNQANQASVKPHSSRYRGVRWHSRAKRWYAEVKANQRCVYLGSFTNEVDAAIAYDEAAIRFFGEFASPNFPQGERLSTT